MFRQGLWIRDGRVTHAWEQPGRVGILEAVAATRREHPVADRPGFGRWALSVPLEDHAQLVRKYPELGSPDARIRSAAWLRFIKSPESAPYRMRDRI